MSVQTEYKTNPGPAKPQFVSLNIDVRGMDEIKIADLREKVEAFASNLNAETGDVLCRVEVR